MYPAHFPAAERVVLHLGGSPGAVTKVTELRLCSAQGFSCVRQQSPRVNGNRCPLANCAQML